LCGRYTFTLDEGEIRRWLGLDSIPFEWTPRYNVAPGQMIPAVIQHREERRIGQLRWGLVPYWAKDENLAWKLINARIETAAEKPSFKHSLQRKRCLIPADGYYEWKQVGGDKQPLRIRLRSRPAFMFAGLYDTWVRPDGSKLHTCTILTTRANGKLAGIHPRMPVILREEDEARWLSPEWDPGLLQELAEPYPEEETTAYAVSKEVGNVRNDHPGLIEPCG
jgi:putative SOS response-associated peptidase YedK